MAIWFIFIRTVNGSSEETILNESMAVHYNFSISFKHILRHHNPVADALSRYQEQKFRRLAPCANTLPTKIPNELWTD